MAANGHKQYAYSTKALTQITREHTGNIEYMVEAKVDSGKEFDTLTVNLDSNTNCTCTGSKPRPLLAKPKHDLTGNDNVKADWMKGVKKLQSDLDRDHNNFLQLGIKGGGMIKENAIGVSKEMLQACKQAEYDILSHIMYISEVIILSTL